MPEGDTVFHTAHRLHSALAGRTITRFELRVARFALADCVGQDVVAVVARGKHLLMRISNAWTLHSHLMMDGTWRISESRVGPRGGPGHQIRALIGNDQWLAAGYRVHGLTLIRTDRESELVGHLGPDLLDPDWDRNEALRRFHEASGVNVADVLLDQRVVAGIGNVVKSELLFRHRLNPWAPADSVADPGALLEDAATLLDQNKLTYSRSTTGSRRPGEQYWVYGRQGRGCRRCGTAIRKDEQGDRITYYCPECQRAY